MVTGQYSSVVLISLIILLALTIIRTPESHPRGVCRSRIKFLNFGLRYDFIWRLKIANQVLCENRAKILQGWPELYCMCRSPDKIGQER